MADATIAERPMKDTLKDIKVIDVDTHISEPFDLWTSRAPAKFKDRVPQMRELDGRLVWTIDGDRSLGVGSASSVVYADGRKADGVESTKPFGEVAGKSVTGHGAFGFRKEDTALLEAFNAELETFIGTPEHIALVEPFGFGADFLPTKTTAELCAGE